MKKIEAFQATDGALFNTEDACTEHEFSLLWLSKIDQFTKNKNCPYPSGAQAGMMKKILISWERFKAEQRDKVND
jgi:hypothetical protein